MGKIFWQFANFSRESTVYIFRIEGWAKQPVRCEGQADSCCAHKVVLLTATGMSV
jgi:hypothetical protein